MPGRILPVAVLLAAPALAAADYPLDGNWRGKGYMAGATECPSFEVHLSIAGHRAVGRFLEGDHAIELTAELDDSGAFSGTFVTASNRRVRVEGAHDGTRFHGYLNNPRCRGSWYAERVEQAAPASQPGRAAAASPAQEPGLVEQLRLLQDLRQQGLVEEADYARRREMLLDALLSATAGGATPPASAGEAVAGGKAGLLAGLDLGRYHALVIANDNYAHFSKLSWAVADGLAVAQVLRDHYGFAVELQVDAKRYDIISALTRFRRELTYSDNLLIYYAGHGVLDHWTNEGYWVPVDGEKDNPANWVANADVTSALRAIQAKHIMLVVDSCFSGSLTRAAEAELPASAERDAWFRRIADKVGRTVLTSGGLEPVLDGGGGKHSVFAKAFLEVLRENREIIDGQTVFTRIKRPVVVNAAQTPKYSDIRFTGHDGGDFLFARVR